MKSEISVKEQFEELLQKAYEKAKADKNLPHNDLDVDNEQLL